MIFKGALKIIQKPLSWRKYEKAYPARALCNEKLGKIQEAIETTKWPLVLTQKNKELYYNTGRLMASLNQNKEADEMLRKAYERDKGYGALKAEVGVLFKLHDYYYGDVVTMWLIDAKNTSKFYITMPWCWTVLKIWQKPNVFTAAPKYGSKFMPAYVSLALTEMRLGKIWWRT